MPANLDLMRRPVRLQDSSHILRDELEICWSQPFGWGIVIIEDLSNNEDLPDLGVPAVIVAANETSVVVSVLHCREFEVPDEWPDDVAVPLDQVAIAVVHTEIPETSGVKFDGVVLCPSGRLRIGDAETQTVIEVPPGPQHMQISCFPRRHAEAVIISIQTPPS